MLVWGVQRLVRQQEWPSRSQVSIYRVQRGLVPRSEIIRGGEGSGRGKRELDNTVPVIHSASVQIERAISCRKEGIEARISRRRSCTLPYPTFEPIGRSNPGRFLL